MNCRETKTRKLFPLNLTKTTDELKELIKEHPDYPIVVLAGESANSGDYTWMYCSSISFGVEEMLDCEVPYDRDFVCVDRDEFNEELEEWLWDELGCSDKQSKITEDEFQKKLKEEKVKYEPYWKKVISICAEN